MLVARMQAIKAIVTVGIIVGLFYWVAPSPTKVAASENRITNFIAKSVGVINEVLTASVKNIGIVGLTLELDNAVDHFVFFQILDNSKPIRLMEPIRIGPYLTFLNAVHVTE